MYSYSSQNTPNQTHSMFNLSTIEREIKAKAKSQKPAKISSKPTKNTLIQSKLPFQNPKADESKVADNPQKIEKSCPSESDKSTIKIDYTPKDFIEFDNFMGLLAVFDKCKGVKVDGLGEEGREL